MEITDAGKEVVRTPMLAYRGRRQSQWTAQCKSQRIGNITSEIRIAFDSHRQNAVVPDSKCLGGIGFDERRVFACHCVKERTTSLRG